MENAAFAATSKKEMCQQHMHRYVLVQMADGTCFDGIVEYVDDEVLCIAVPFGQGEGDARAFFPFGGFFPRRRFFRRTFPLGALLALSLLPYYF